MHPLSEDDELSMYETAIDTLGAAGFEHYEISNFGKPGYRSRHNSVYWANHAYFGFGMGAAKYLKLHPQLECAFARRIFDACPPRTADGVSIGNAG
ncbi:MAG: hypothetical protein U0744_14860 [Gemmataceae bacterium]